MSRPYKNYFNPSPTGSVMTWWNALTIDEKVKARALYEEQRKVHFATKRHNYNSMASTENFRISQLTPSLIERIYVFKDRDLNYFK